MLRLRIVSSFVLGFAAFAAPSAWSAQCRFVRDKKIQDPVQWRCCDADVNTVLKGWCTGLPGGAAGADRSKVKDNQNAWWAGGKVTPFAAGAAGNPCAVGDPQKKMPLAFHCDQKPTTPPTTDAIPPPTWIRTRLPRTPMHRRTR